MAVPIDMTYQLAPFLWGMVVVLFISAAWIVHEARHPHK